MRIILGAEWMHTLADELLDHDYRSEYSDLDNYDVITAIITGMVDDTYFDVLDHHQESRWRAHVQARLLELFRGSYFNMRSAKRAIKSTTGIFPEHLHGLTRELTELPCLPSLYRYIWRLLSGHVVEVHKVEYPINQVIVVNLRVRDAKRRLYA